MQGQRLTDNNDGPSSETVVAPGQHKKPKQILTPFVEIACLKCEDQGPYFSESLPQKGDSHLCHKVCHLGNSFFAFFFEKQCSKCSSEIRVCGNSAEVVYLQSVTSYTLNRPDHQ